MKDGSARHVACPLILLFALTFAFWAQGDKVLCEPRSFDASQSRPRRPPITSRAVMPPFVVQLSQNAVKLEKPDETGRILSSSPIGIKVGNALLGWRIVCRAEDAPGPDGAKIPASDILILSQRRLNGSTAASAPATAADKPVIIVQGRGLAGPSMQEVGAFAVQAQISLDTPPGVYRGVLRVYADAPNISPISVNAAGANAGSSPVQDIVLTLSVPDCVKITVSGEPMSFGSVQPGSSGPNLFTSLNTPRVIIETNQRRLQVQVVMDALRLEGAATTQIAGNQTALAWGKTPAEALQKVQTTTIGSNQFIYPLDKAGIYTFYLAGRVAISMTDAPGSYKGRATITANVQ